MDTESYDFNPDLNDDLDVYRVVDGQLKPVEEDL